MKKAILALSILSILGTTAVASNHGRMTKSEHSKWCEQNWEKCKEHKLEKLAIEEKYIAKKRECIQKAKDHQSYRQCKASVKEQERKELQELKQRIGLSK